MSDIEQIDFSTLIWVKKELDETLKRAQNSIEEYVENPEDENQLQFCATYLHQVQGTLKMVELYGAAMVAEEMEQVVKKILNKEVDSEKDSFEVLMRGIILLPDYLERIQLGYKDIPMVLLPLVNDLRTVKGDQLLSESALFNPDLSLGLPEANLRSSFTLSHNQLVQVVKKIRSAYQVCLLNWLKGNDVKSNLKKIQIIVDKLKTVISPLDEKQLFWVAGGLFEALISGGLDESVTVKQLAARLDQTIRMLTIPDSKDARIYKELTNNLLYYVALANSKDRRIKEIQQFFNLSDFISDDKEIEHAQSSLSGKNRELLESVTNVIKEDLMTIQENLDLYNRNDNALPTDLEKISKAMSKIADTLGIIGIGIAREKIRDDIKLLEDNFDNDEKIDNDTIMHIAETLLFVESSLDENILLLGEVKQVKESSDKNQISSAEMKKIMNTLAKESIHNLQKIKHNFIQYIEAPWIKESIESSPKLLKEVSGALNMSGYKDVADEIDKIEVYTSKYMLDPSFKPSANQLDFLAESIASLEYYLEYISDGVKGEKRILELAKSNINLLFETVEKAEKLQKQSNVIDADLDQMNDDDFEMDMDIDDDLANNLEFGLDDDNDIEQSLETDLEEEFGIDAPELEQTDNVQVQNDDQLDVYELKLEKPKLRPDLFVTFSDETDDDIKEIFLEEFEEELEHLETIFPKWKSNPDEQVELLGDIRRIYHTLKGSGRLVGADAIGDFSWHIEDMTNLVLNDASRLNTSFTLVLQSCTDILPLMLDALKNGSIVPLGYYEIIEAADKVINGEIVTEIKFDEKIVDIDTEDTNESQVVDILLEEDSLSEEVVSETVIVDIDEDIEADVDDLSVDPVFVEILQQEVEGHLVDISEFLNHIENSGNAKSTEKFIRVIHTLNGAANMASVKSIVEMTSPLELVAKLTNEKNKEFSEETLLKISEFRQEASNIMKDLSNCSASNDVTLAIGSYFQGIFNDLDSIENIEDLTEDGLSIADLDLSDFIDSNDEEAKLDEKVIEEAIDNDELDLGAIDFDVELEPGNVSEINIEGLNFDNDEVELNLEGSETDEIDIDDLLGFNIDDITEDEILVEDVTEDEVSVGNIPEDEILVEDVTEDEVSVEDIPEDEILVEDIPEDEILVEDIPEDEILVEDVTEDEILVEDVTEDEVSVGNIPEDEISVGEVESASEHISAIISTSYSQDSTDESDEADDGFDEELLEIFKEEADDILDRTEHILSELEENPKEPAHILALQRDLHTLKGGARMAGLENIGELGHVLESLLENIGEENRKVDKTILEAIHESFDMLNKMKESKDLGQNTDVSSIVRKVKHLVGLEGDLIPEESKLDLDYFKPINPLDVIEDETTETIIEEVSTIKKKSNVLSGNQIKVNSELLDNLVNYAGEVSIYRSRLEQEIGSFRVNLSELGNTVARIKEQLRNLDAETEAQIISTFSTDEDDEGFDPLEMDRFSQLQQLSRSLTESVSDLTSIHSYLDDVARTSDNLLSQQSRVNTELQEGLMETRLVSFNSIVPRLRRLVRTTSKELNKPVKLEVHGAEGEMDKTVLEGVIAPLEHMLRNSLAHGIEENRTKAEKDAQGTIIIDVRREATEVVISISDDGAGINRKKVKELAVKKGILKKGAKISEKNIDRLILHSGFSTVDVVSKLAGRGVGMDVVSNQINLLGGSLDIKSEPNVGTKFGIRLPYTLALSSALLVEIAETIFAIPVSGLEGIIRMSYADYLQKVKDQDFNYEYANESYQLQDLNKLLDIDSEVIVENNQIPLVMIRSGDKGVALRVDNILGSREVVVKTVGTQISSVPGIYGATILGDGNVVLILDIIPLSRSYLEKLANLDESDYVVEEIEVEKDPIIMIVDDSITMRKVGERVLRRNNYDVLTAKDGLDALDLLKETIPDVMLLDIEMPRMDGYELAIEMKKDEKYANIPIIMITSRTGEKHRQKAMDLGVDRYLGKPYQEADLLSNISDFIDSRDS